MMLFVIYVYKIRFLYRKKRLWGFNIVGTCGNMTDDVILSLVSGYRDINISGINLNYVRR